ncbi:MAG: DUF1269 domain-containing protein [Candidatus Binatia bacterium]
MATLTALKFDTADGAGYALNDLVRLHQQQRITLLDAALVTWPKGKSRPGTRHGISSVGVSKMDGAFWGMLFGLIFFTPLMGASAGAFRDALSELGIQDKFIHEVRNKVREDTSALFVLSSHALANSFADEFKRTKPDLISTNLPQVEENRLLELFAQPHPVRAGIRL